MNPKRIYDIFKQKFPQMTDEVIKFKTDRHGSYTILLIRKNMLCPLRFSYKDEKHWNLGTEDWNEH